MRRIPRHLTYANVMATIALFLVLGGSAYAAFHLPNNSVRSKSIVNKQVKKPDLTPAEPFHKVGAPGEPNFGNGGQNDCRWNRPSGGGQISPPVFYKDPYGVVHMAGLAFGEDGPGGDGMCDDNRDGIIFRLPRADRPARQVDVRSVTGQPLVVIGRRQAGPFPAGAVVTAPQSPQSLAIFDSLSFRAAGPGTGLAAKSSSSPTKAPNLDPLQKLLK
jgi:hypothetical protein